MNTNIDQTLSSFNEALKNLVSSVQTPIAQEVVNHLEFKCRKNETNAGKGFLWTGEGPTKQLVFNPHPDRFFSSETIELAKGKSISVVGSKLIDENELGLTVTKSNLEQLGRLKGLIVDGSVSINQHVVYNSKTKRLGIGTDNPNSTISIVDNGTELLLGINEKSHGIFGTYNSTNLDLVSGNIPRLSIAANGNIVLGNFNSNPIQVKINGKLSVGIDSPDPNVDLHVVGPVRIHNHVHMYANTPPKFGTYSKGDIVWNENPVPGKNVGWVCLTPGSPGKWYPFGEIRESYN